MEKTNRRIYRTECQRAYQNTVSKLASVFFLILVGVCIILTYLLYDHLVSDPDKVRLKRYKLVIITLALLTSTTGVFTLWSWRMAKRGFGICTGEPSLVIY